MAVTYRLLHPSEEDAAVELWVRVLETSAYEARETFHDFHANPQRFQQAHVAVDEEGRLLSTVCYWLRELRDAEGKAVRVGHVFHVATEPSARRQGHATRLLADAAAALRAAGCAWSLLSARQDAAALYIRAGWQPILRRYWRGACTAEGLPKAPTHTIRQFDPRQEAEGWAQLASAYARANRRQAGSLVRTPEYWSGYAAWMFGLYLGEYEAMLFVAQGDGAGGLSGYVLANFYDQGFVVSEVAAGPDEPELLRSLLIAVLSESQRRGIPLQGQLTLAAEPAAQAVLQELFGTTLHTVDDIELYGYQSFMLRQLGSAPVSPFDSPHALFWPLDAY